MYPWVPSIKLPTVIIQNNEKTRVIIIAFKATSLLHVASVKPHLDFKTINEPNQIYLLSTYSIWIGFEMTLIQLMTSSAPEMVIACDEPNANERQKQIWLVSIRYVDLPTGRAQNFSQTQSASYKFFMFSVAKDFKKFKV